MALAAKRPCTHPGCGVLTETGRCPKHVFVEKKAHEIQRPNSTARGYGYRWQQASKGFLRQHPLCQCPECGDGRIRVRAASVVDHRIPHRGDMALFWDRSNWQSMAKDCHDAKTAREDGAFGNPTRVGGRGQKSGADSL